MATVRELITRWGFDIQDKAILELDTNISKLKSSLFKLGVATSAALTAVILPAAVLQDKIVDTLTLTGATGKEFKDLEKGMTAAAIRLSEKLGISASEIAVSFYQVLSTGAKALSPEFNALASVALKMSKTIGLEASNAVEKLNDTLNAFRLNQTEAGRAADVFFMTSRLAATTVPQLTEAMRDAAPAAATLGLSLEETSAILASFAQVGVKGSLAGRAFRQIMLKLAKPTKEGTEALARLGTKVFEGGKIRQTISIFRDMQKGLQKLSQEAGAASLKALAGEEAFSRLSALLGSDLDLLEDWTKKLEDSGGALDLAFNQKISTAQEQLKKFWISIKNLLATVGAPLLGFLSKTADALSEIVTGIRSILVTYPTLTRFVSIIGGIVLAVTTLSAGIASATLAMKMFGNVSLIAYAKLLAPIIAIIAVIALIALAIEDIVAYFKGKKSVTALMIQGFKMVFQDIKLGIQDFLEKIKNYFLDWAESMKKLFTQIGKDILNAFIDLDVAKEQFNKLIDIATTAIDKIKGFFSDVAEFFGFKEQEPIEQKITTTSELLTPRQKLDIVKPDTSFIGPVKPNNIITKINAPITIDVPAGTPPEKVSKAVKEGIKGELDVILRSTALATEPQSYY